MVALRVRAELFAPTVTVTEPLPEPLIGDAVIQDALDETDQTQPSAALTLIAALPPAAGTGIVVVDSV